MHRVLVNPAIADLMAKLRPLLLQYLQQQGVAAQDRGKFRCFNPEHTDNTPSMHFIPKSNGARVKCWGCKASYDVFGAHAVLMKRPTNGPGFLHQNVYDLARRFGVEFQEVEPTEQEILLMQLWRLYQDAADVLEELLIEKKEENSSEYFEHCMKRGLHVETCIDFIVGSVPWRTFVGRMRVRGHEVEFMKQYDVSQDMFDTDKITITLRDRNGAVVGFASRWVNWNKQEEQFSRSKGSYYRPKFVNTSAKVPFFQKEALLYNLDRAKKESYRRGEVFEGYFDVMHAWQAGLKTVMCACGTSLNEFQVMQAQEEGFGHLNVVGDADKAGLDAMMKAVDTMSGREGLKVTVTFLHFGPEVPVADRDPDTFFRMYGKDAYLALPEVTGFEWKIFIEMQGAWDPYQVAKKMIPLILNERDRIERGRFIKILVDKTKVPEEDVRSEIAKRESTRIDAVGQDLMKDLARAKDSQDRAEAIRRASASMLDVTMEITDVSIRESHLAFMSSFTKFQEKRKGMRGWKTLFPQFDRDFEGFPKEGEVIGIAGPPNSGKSAIVTNFAINMVIANPEGLSVIYHIMDDPREIAHAKIMSCLTGFSIRMIRNAEEEILPYPHLATAFTNAGMWVEVQMKTGRLVIKGQEMGVGTEVATKMIDHVSGKTGNKVVYVADSLHNIVAEGGSDDRRTNFIAVTEWAKRMSDIRRMSMLFTCELTKEGMKDKPRLFMTAETSAIAYGFKAVGLVWNELHTRRDQAQTFWTDKLIDPKSGQPLIDPETQNPAPDARRPIVEVIWEKNKISEYKGSHFYRFWDHASRVEEMTFQDLVNEREKAKNAKFGLHNVGALGSFVGALPPPRPMNVLPPGQMR